MRRAIPSLAARPPRLRNLCVSCVFVMPRAHTKHVTHARATARTHTDAFTDPPRFQTTAGLAKKKGKTGSSTLLKVKPNGVHTPTTSRSHSTLAPPHAHARTHSVQARSAAPHTRTKQMPPAHRATRSARAPLTSPAPPAPRPALAATTRRDTTRPCTAPASGTPASKARRPAAAAPAASSSSSSQPRVSLPRSLFERDARGRRGECVGGRGRGGGRVRA